MESLYAPRMQRGALYITTLRLHSGDSNLGANNLRDGI
jgi:hypothetical protein